MMGLDISDKMVQLARAKNLYTSVMQVINTTLSLNDNDDDDDIQADLMRPLPLSSSSQDVLTCVGVTTYLEPHVIVEWCKVVRSGDKHIYVNHTKKGTLKVDT